MSINSAAVCKVIVQDSSPEYEQRIKAFCDDNNLIAVKSTASNIMDVLKSNVDLGAIFLSADLRHLDDQGKPLYQKIHKIRPELPIILRTEASEREELNTHKNQGGENVRLQLQITSPRRAADKLKYLAGSESAMGAFIADFPPETTAEMLRGAIK